MTGPERGFLLLCSHFGDPNRRPLTIAQFRQLAQRMKNTKNPGENRDLEPSDLKALGYGDADTDRILDLLSEEYRLDRYLQQAQQVGCGILTRFSGYYPRELDDALGDDAPALLWYKGNAELLTGPKIALVGSRDILPSNEDFARQVGIQAARQGFALVSGNARGADRIAQDACLESGGKVISIVADSLKHRTPAFNHLLVCEDSFDLDFNKIRALSRNRIIHTLGQVTLVAQSALEKGGTWDGTVRNLRHGWSPVCCFDDGSLSADALEQMGARLIGQEDLDDLHSLTRIDHNFLNL